jgi:hypothetical protein
MEGILPPIIYGQDGKQKGNEFRNDEQRCAQQRLRTLPKMTSYNITKPTNTKYTIRSSSSSSSKNSHQPHDKEGDHHQDEAPGDDLRDPCIGVVIQSHVEVVLVGVVG